MPPWLPAWAIAPIMMLATAAGLAVVFSEPSWILGAVLGVVLGAAFLWVLVSSLLFPAEADRRCPSCGEEALERMDPQTTTGLRCTACGHEDPQASGWFLAEEEGPLEDLVLRSRGRAPHSPSEDGPTRPSGE
ncbi:MAG: hypothetical protein ACI9HE_003714 [Planctomycetota bacterium]